MRYILSIMIASLLLALPLAAQLPVRIQGQSLLFLPEGDYTRAEAGYRVRSEDEAFLPAEGRGLFQGEFELAARHRLDSLSRVEGFARYEQGVKRSVRWNTSSDWALLAPYVTLDTLGGDLQKEQYTFRARYARTIGESFVDGAISYRALHEYRDFDPRPRNVTADLELTLAGGIRTGCSALSLEAGYRKYHQNGMLDFKDPRGHNTTIFHWLGLGSHYARLAPSLDIRFRGEGFSTALRLEPLDGTGWTGHLSYAWLDIVRHAKGQNEAPMSSLLHQELELNGGYKWRHASVAADLSYRLRQGTENVLDGVGSYLSLAELTLYREPAFEAALSGTLESGRWTWAPSARYVYRMAEGVYPARDFSLSYTEMLFATAYSAASDGPWAFDAGLSLGGHVTLDGDYHIPSSLLDDRFRAYYDGLYERFADHAVFAALRGTVSRRIADDLRLRLGAEAGFTHYFTGHRRIDARLTFGIIF